MAYVEGQDGDAAVVAFADDLVLADVHGAVVEGVCADEEQSQDGHPCQSCLEEQPEEDEGDVDEEEDGECQGQQREAWQVIGRYVCQCPTQPEEEYGAEVCAEEDADRGCG